MADIYGRMNRIMDSMLILFNHIKKCTFQIDNTNIEVDMALKRIMNFFGLNANEAAVFTYLFVVYFDCNEKPVSPGYLADNAETNVLRLLAFRDEFTSLEQKGFIYTDSPGETVSHAKHYRVPDGIIDAVVKGDEHLVSKGLHSKERDLVYPEEIKVKELFYPDSIRKEISSLEEYLAKGKLEAIQQRLEEKNMPKGVCVMLYGESGTGKTETVYQLARKTGRTIFHVDLGATISMWHGGTEKNVSATFDKYARLCRQARALNEAIPILLFNEADAIFGNRIEHPVQGAEVDENHIQSVLLDYMEKQDGILVVTTNLEKAFDKAFERRFLFKIKYEKPDSAITEKIWKNKAGWLNKKSVAQLASSYAFSGAEIENVVRKATMKEILTGKRSSFSEIEEYCRREKLENEKRSKIGFN